MLSLLFWMMLAALERRAEDLHHISPMLEIVTIIMLQFRIWTPGFQHPILEQTEDPAMIALDPPVTLLDRGREMDAVERDTLTLEFFDRGDGFPDVFVEVPGDPHHTDIRLTRDGERERQR